MGAEMPLPHVGTVPEIGEAAATYTGASIEEIEASLPHWEPGLLVIRVMWYSKWTRRLLPLPTKEPAPELASLPATAGPEG
jgi:hypothetical protein